MYKIINIIIKNICIALLFNFFMDVNPVITILVLLG